MGNTVQTIDISRAAESLAGMVADWYGNAPLPNARISAKVIAQRLERFTAKDEAALDAGSQEHARVIVRSARAVLDRLVKYSPDYGVDEFLDAINDARLLIAKIDGAE